MFQREFVEIAHSLKVSDEIYFSIYRYLKSNFTVIAVAFAGKVTTTMFLQICHYIME